MDSVYDCDGFCVLFLRLHNGRFGLPFFSSLESQSASKLASYVKNTFYGQIEIHFRQN